jgi:hypothetical protein
MRTIRQPVSSRSLDEFVFETDESSPEFVVEFFCDWLKGYVHGGAEFREGQTLQFGYATLTCEVRGRSLRLVAPDFASMPIQPTRNLGQAFRIMVMQKYAAESLGFAPDLPWMLQTAVVYNGLEDPGLQAYPLFAERCEPSANNPDDSGWVVGSTDPAIDNNNAANFQLMTLYQAMLYVPQVLMFLSLPIGAQVVFSERPPVISQHGKRLTIGRGTFLERYFAGG